MASSAAVCAADCAANGVLLREPLMPCTRPAEHQEITLPSLSVSATCVLLNVALMWATPVESTTFFSFLRPFWRPLGDAM